MSDTPETDAFQQTDQCAYDSMWRGFARKLERERDESRKKTQWKQIRIEVLLRLNQKLHSERDEWKEVAEGSLLGAIKERDEAVSSCQIWQQGHSKIVEDRDYWKAKAERWREIKQ